MSFKAKKIIFFILMFLLSFYVGKLVYAYYFDDSIPNIILVGIENEKGYAGNVNCIISVSDEYKVKQLSVELDDKIVLNKYSVNSSSFDYQFLIPTMTMNDGRHTLKIFAIDASKKENRAEKEINFYVDNLPLEVQFIKQAEKIKVGQGSTLHVFFQANKSNITGFAKTLSYQSPCVLESNKSRIYESFIPISTDEVPNEYILTMNLSDMVGNVAVLETSYQVVPTNFKKQQIGLGKKFENIGARSNEDLMEILKNSSVNSPNKKLWTGKFYVPCVYKTVTTSFGVIRTSLERGRYRHDAVDLAAAPKSPVWACQDGIVIVKDNFMFTGQTVVIDHGCGIISLYGHLDSFGDIEVGKSVKKGNIIGRVGMTGYAKGYHLHWEIRICDVQVNPMEWIADDL